MKEPWLCPFWFNIGWPEDGDMWRFGVWLQPSTSDQRALMVGEHDEGIVIYGATAQIALESAKSWVRKRERELCLAIGELQLGAQLSEPPGGSWEQPRR